MVHAEATATTAATAAQACHRGDTQDAQSTACATATEERLEAQWFEIEFSVDLSRRYHQARRDFFDGWHKALMVVVIACGSAAVMRLIPYPELLGGIAALVGALNLAFGLSHKARDHELLYRRFTDLAADLRTHGSPEAAQRERRKIERDEPPVYWLLADLCHWETATAFGCDPGIERPNVRLRLIMHYLTTPRAKAVPAATPRATPETPSST